ncbi:hypothetical protein [Erwinia sp. HR93]|uniref:hypothetical protein n=1 Tax=Erwinia sp. HR93 TaxID=3094840 RepID=UPI002ADED6C0|nr:hypothetical protein [Erwinia sp. HR93]MEA1064776.1 hypothetical protein [Erwinia sp. HR93]
MGNNAASVNRLVRMRLATTNREEVQGWLPHGEIHPDLLALLHVYLGLSSRCPAAIVCGHRLLPGATMSSQPCRGAVQLDRTAVMRPLDSINTSVHSKILTINLGCYERAQGHIHRREIDEDGNYRW